MRTILVTIITAAVLGGAPSWAAAPVGAGKVFSGPEGEQVAIVPLTPRESKKALLYLQGTGGEFEGMVLPHTVEEQGDNVYYTTQWRGRDFTTFFVRAGGSGRSHQLTVPGRRDSIPVSYDDARTRALKAEDVYVLHQKQQADGSLTRLMAFDQKAERAGEEQGLAEAVKSMNEACGTSVAATIAWDTIPDDLLKALSISSYCSSPLSALEKLCESNAAKQVLQARVKKVDCRFGAAMKLELQQGSVTWTTARDAGNTEEFATQYFEKNLESPWEAGKSLGEAMLQEKTSVCTDGKGHYVVVSPHETKSVQLSYGDGRKFVQVPLPPFGLSGESFLEPRFVDKTRNPSFRGLDMRVYSEVDLDAKAGTCVLRCGERTLPLTILELDEAQKLLREATFEPNPQKYAPYALLRDLQGRYYLVERGFQPSEEKSFRVFVGPKGDLQQQKLVNIVSDSEGEIFSTKKGDLRLVVDRQLPSMWIESKKKLELRQVPVSENLPLIYNELGVYTGVRLGTPCDDQ